MFELRSFLGRNFFNKKAPKVSNTYNLLHLGCGKTILHSWVNADFFSIPLKFWKKTSWKSIKRDVNWFLDLRYPLNCDNNYWDGIFTEHTLEHLHPLDVLNLLKESYRTLKPGSWIRISVPNLKCYVDYYCGKTDENFSSRWATGAEAIRALTQNFGHLSVWDAELMIQTLQSVGFTNVNEVQFGKGTDQRLIKDSEARRWGTLYVEAQKPLNK